MRLSSTFAAVCGTVLTLGAVTAVTLGVRSGQSPVVQPLDRAPLPQVAQAPPLNLAKRIGHLGVSELFKAEGIKRRSSMKCADRLKKGCTSFEGMRLGTVNGILAFEDASDCKLTVSGGTEIGHAKMRYSHENGYKIDIMPSKCVDSFVHRTMKKVGERNDGSEMYRDRPGQLYVDEKATHWDIFYGPEWCVKKLIKHARCE